MTQSNPTAGILETLRKQQETKLQVVQRLVASREELARIEAQRVEQQREDAAAYKAALDGGWSEAELRAAGITPPVKPGPGRPRTSGTSRSRNRQVPPAAAAALSDQGDGQGHEGDRVPDDVASLTEQVGADS